MAVSPRQSPNAALPIGFAHWISVDSYAVYDCVSLCGFAFLNTTGMTDFEMQDGLTQMKWRIASVNSTLAQVDVNVVGEGKALKICEGCFTKVVPFKLNETLRIVVDLASGSIFLNQTYLGKNVFWLPKAVQEGEVVDAGIGLTNNGSYIPLRSVVTKGSTSEYPSIITLNCIKAAPYIRFADSYDPNLGYALILEMPGIPALPDGTLRMGDLRVNNQSVTSIAGLPLAAALQLHYLSPNIFRLTNTNISPPLSESQMPCLLINNDILATIISATAAIFLVLLWRRKFRSRGDCRLLSVFIGYAGGGATPA
jgi:hypothetical protein